MGRMRNWLRTGKVPVRERPGRVGARVGTPPAEVWTSDLIDGEDGEDACADDCVGDAGGDCVVCLDGDDVCGKVNGDGGTCTLTSPLIFPPPICSFSSSKFFKNSCVTRRNFST